MISLFTALNTVVISSFPGSSTFCCCREKDSFLGLQQAVLRAEAGLKLLFMDVLLCRGGICILNPVLCPPLSCLGAFTSSCFCALLTVFPTKVLENFSSAFPFGMVCMVICSLRLMGAVRWGYFLLRALARGLISTHSAIVSACVRLDSFELPFHHLYKHSQTILSSACRKHCEKWNSWSQLLLLMAPTAFCKQECTK